MKNPLGTPRRIRFDEELEQTIENLEGDFSKAVRRLCRQAVSGSHQVHDLENTFKRLETIRKQIAPIGSNLNQIATCFNSDGHLYSEGLADVHSDLQTQFKEMTGVLKELRQRIIHQLY